MLTVMYFKFCTFTTREKNVLKVLKIKTFKLIKNVPKIRSYEDLRANSAAGSSYLNFT